MQSLLTPTPFLRHRAQQNHANDNQREDVGPPLMSASVIDCPTFPASPQPRRNSLKEKVANKEPGEGEGVGGGRRGGFYPAGSEVWERSGKVRWGSKRGGRWAEPTGVSPGRAPLPVSSRCKRLTQPGSEGSEWDGSTATQPAPPPAGGTNLFLHPEVDKCETCCWFLQD